MAAVMVYQEAMDHVFKEIDRDPLTEQEQIKADSMKLSLVIDGSCDIGRGGVFSKWEASEIFDEFQDDNLFRALADLFKRNGDEDRLRAISKLESWLDRTAEVALKDKARYAMELSR